MLVDRGKESVDPVTGPRHHRQDRHQSLLGRGQRHDGLAQQTAQFRGSGLVRLVDDQDVTDFEDAGLDRLHPVAQPRHLQDHHRLRQPGDLDAVLAGAHGFDQNDVEANRVEEMDDIRRGQRQSAHPAPRRHAANEDAFVAVALRHPNAVAQDSAAADRAARIDRQHRDPAVADANCADQGVDQRALTDAGRPGNADHVRLAGLGVELSEGPLPGLVPLLQQGDQARQGSRIARADAIGQFHRSYPSSSRTGALALM